MGGRGGYYGGGRARASTKVLSGGPRVAQSGVSARRGPAVAPKPAATLADAKKRASTQALRTVAERRKAAAPPLYTCPMHPQVQWTKPTDCPICGMKLKLKQAKAGAAKRAPAADDEHAGMDMDETGDMPGMDMRDDMGGMDDMMCCPGCMSGMGGMSGMKGKQAPAASRKASGGSMRGRGMAGMGCGC